MSPPTTATPAIRKTLRDTFGISRLRAGQEEVIANVLARRDTLAIMPTGRPAGARAHRHRDTFGGDRYREAAQSAADEGRQHRHLPVQPALPRDARDER